MDKKIIITASNMQSYYRAKKIIKHIMDQVAPDDFLGCFLFVAKVKENKNISPLVLKLMPQKIQEACDKYVMDSYREVPDDNSHEQ